MSQAPAMTLIRWTARPERSAACERRRCRTSGRRQVDWLAPIPQTSDRIASIQTRTSAWQRSLPSQLNRSRPIGSRPRSGIVGSLGSEFILLRTLWSRRLPFGWRGDHRAAAQNSWSRLRGDRNGTVLTEDEDQHARGCHCETREPAIELATRGLGRSLAKPVRQHRPDAVGLP